MADFHKQSSFYRKTPVKDFYLDLWIPRLITPQDDDVEAIIDPLHHKRPDKLANKLYSTPGLFWVFAIRNKDDIIDPINDFIAGRKIYIPSAQYIKKVLL